MNRAERRRNERLAAERDAHCGPDCGCNGFVVRQVMGTCPACGAAWDFETPPMPSGMAVGELGPVEFGCGDCGTAVPGSGLVVEQF